MKKLRNSGNFFLVLLFNMLMNLEWTIPAWLLLLCHFFFDWSIKWFWIALGIWLLNILFWMDILGWAARCGNKKDQPRENKNPYSVKTSLRSEKRDGTNQK